MTAADRADRHLHDLRRWAESRPQVARTAARALAALGPALAVPRLEALLRELDAVDLDDDAGDTLDEVVATRAIAQEALADLSRR